jgi:hypothetical protein
MTLVRSFAMLGAAVVPLVALTAMAFFGGGGKTEATSYEPAEVAALDAVEAATSVRIAKLPEVEAAAAEDPAGFSSGGDPVASLSLPYEVAQQLAEAEKAIRSDDVGIVQRAKKSLQKLAGDRLPAIEKLRPHGDSLAKAIAGRASAIEHHEVWLSKRAVVRETLASAAAAIADGPEIDGEKKCLELLRKLQKDLPQVADADTVGTEPGDALTVDEAEAVAKLASRATFREQFFTARRATVAKSEKTSELKSELDAWDAFLKTYAKAGAPDSRDAALFEEGKKLRYEAELTWRWALALSQPSVGGLVTKVADWRRVSRSAKNDDTSDQQAAAELVRSWLAKNIQQAPLRPKGLDGLQEGFTDPANKRKVGYFKPVPQTEKQYYYWTGKPLIKAKPKGESQFNLRSPPSAPVYLVILLDYDRCRKAFLSEGHQTAAGSAQFREECARLGQKYATYRTDYEEPDNPFDAEAKGWEETFAKAEKIAAELVAEGDKAGVWELLAPVAN